MSQSRQILLAIAISTATMGAWAQSDAEHKQHQAAAAAQSSAAPAASVTSPDGAQNMAAMDSKMKAMSEMHQKIMGAKTPAEKKALMAEQMKVMQESMKMMGMMGGNGMAGMRRQEQVPVSMSERQDMMSKRLEMMESLMQIMMDQMPPRAR